MARKAINMIGAEHGCLRVKSKSPEKGKDAMWLCFCKRCGEDVIYRRSHILRDHTRCRECRKKGM